MCLLSIHPEPRLAAGGGARQAARPALDLRAAAAPSRGTEPRNVDPPADRAYERGRNNAAERADFLAGEREPRLPGLRVAAGPSPVLAVDPDGAAPVRRTSACPTYRRTDVPASVRRGGPVSALREPDCVPPPVHTVLPSVRPSVRRSECRSECPSDRRRRAGGSAVRDAASRGVAGPAPPRAAVSYHGALARSAGPHAGTRSRGAPLHPCRHGRPRVGTARHPERRARGLDGGDAAPPHDTKQEALRFHAAKTGPMVGSLPRSGLARSARVSDFTSLAFDPSYDAFVNRARCAAARPARLL